MISCSENEREVASPKNKKTTPINLNNLFVAEEQLHTYGELDLCPSVSTRAPSSSSCDEEIHSDIQLQSKTAKTQETTQRNFSEINDPSTAQQPFEQRTGTIIFKNVQKLFINICFL